ncbi:MAG: ligase-associated DNA damage response endonuclease PdeM [Salibacteraceae bacterium]
MTAIELGNSRLQLGNRYIRIDKTLLLADLHLGKTMHFRKAGLPIPAEARSTDQSGLMQLLLQEKPDRVIVLGDLFHSASNSECEELAMITSQFPNINFTLVLGNHDILAPADYRSMDFEVCTKFELDKLILTHEPMDEVPPRYVNIHGHIHPGIRMRGKGLQAMTFPCFHLTQTHLCLPAFGALTGLMKRKPKKGDEVYGILDQEVVKVF